MSKASNYLEEQILNYFFRNQTVTQPSTLYLALYKTDPTDSDTGSEVSGGSYTRQQVIFGATSQVSDRGVVTNQSRIEFNTATGSWGDVSHFGIRTERDGGQLLAYGAFNKPTKIEEGNKFIIESGNLSISVG